VCAQDAAVAVAAALNLTEPSSTGIGGDMFCLFYDAEKKKVFSLNGSGRSAQESSLERVRQQLGDAATAIPTTSVLSVTVPGAAAGWVDCVARFGSGKLNLTQILEPAIRMGEDGYPVSEGTAYYVRLPRLSVSTGERVCVRERRLQLMMRLVGTHREPPTNSVAKWT
jgi:gamma-glutamyltranspeptidase/glutathione hydrolase